MLPASGRELQKTETSSPTSRSRGRTRSVRGMILSLSLSLSLSLAAPPRATSCLRHFSPAGSVSRKARAGRKHGREARERDAEKEKAGRLERDEVGVREEALSPLGRTPGTCLSGT